MQGLAVKNIVRAILMLINFFMCFANAQENYVPESDISKCAASTVEFAERVDQVKLDYSPESLLYIDKVANMFFVRKFPAEKTRHHLLVFGCYAGEVMVRNLKGKWIYPSDKESVEKLGLGPFIQLPKGIVVNPIGKVQKIAENGTADSISQFYAVAEKASH